MHFISSLPADAQSLLGAVRAHWQVENSLHWVLDMAFREDESRVRKDHAPENFAVIRQIALNLFKQDESFDIGINAKRKRAGWDQEYLIQLLCQNRAYAIALFCLQIDFANKSGEDKVHQ